MLDVLKDSAKKVWDEHKDDLIKEMKAATRETLDSVFDQVLGKSRNLEEAEEHWQRQIDRIARSVDEPSATACISANKQGETILLDVSELDEESTHKVEDELHEAGWVVRR